MIHILLGRHGDILNGIPLVYALSRKVGRVNWLVSKDYEGTLEACSYINPVRWDGGPDTLHQAIRKYQAGNPIVAQAWLNPDSVRQTRSYAKEQWRLAGMEHEFGAWPLIFDRLNESRANMLRDRVLAKWDRARPLVLVGVDGISSPFAHGPRLLALLRGLDAYVVDLRDVVAERVYDLIPLFSAADCLVTIDTMPIHLARACYCPVVALLNDEWQGWRASVPPPQCLANFVYSYLGDKEKHLSDVVEATRYCISRPKCKTAMIACNLFDTTSERGKAARATWPGYVTAKPGRTATNICDPRPLPYMKDVLQAGLDTGADFILWLNDDGALAPGAFDAIRAHVSRWDFGCVRRHALHIGREAFWFRSDWLKRHIAEMPDVILAASMSDLVIAKWMRKRRGIPTTMENLGLDFPPVELPPGLIQHEAHESTWIAHQDSPSARHNQALFDAL